VTSDTHGTASDRHDSIDFDSSSSSGFAPWRRGEVPAGSLLAGLAGGFAVHAPAIPAAHGHAPGASGLPPRLAANAIPPARIDMVNPSDNEAMDDRPDDVSILWKNAASKQKTEHLQTVQI